ncbi:MAG: hypothetical protein ACREPQ_09670 [Rhodanobacter sp.]
MTKGVELDRAALVPKICERLATGKESFTAICKDLGTSRKTVNGWCKEDKAIAEQIQDAKDDGDEAIEYECLDISDDNQGDYKLELRGRGEEVVVVDKEAVLRSKLRVDTRLKLLAVRNPTRHGARIHQTITGPNDGPLQVADASAKLLDLLDRRAPGEAAED